MFSFIFPWLTGSGVAGFLQKLGVVDFAGGIVVHISAGFAALASVFIVGKRKILPAEKTQPHNITYVALGTGLLWFGWFGFNGGSALAANGIASIAFVNTDIAGSMAMITWLFISWIHEGKPSMTGALIGAVAGLATITPAAGYVQPWAAAIIGVLAALFVTVRSNCGSNGVGMMPWMFGVAMALAVFGNYHGRCICGLFGKWCQRID